MKIGLGLPNQVRNVNAAVIPEWARQGEELGFSCLATAGRIAYPGVMDTVALAAAAGATRTIKLMPGVFLATTWPAVLAAKELASIDAVSGGRLSLAMGIGGPPRTDDFTVDGMPGHGLGARMDETLQIYRDVWNGSLTGDLGNAFVPEATRQLPMLFGGWSAAALRRAAEWGVGYVGASLPAAMVSPSFDGVRTAWTEAGRTDHPYLVAVVYSALSEPDAGRADMHHYYEPVGDMADVFAESVATTTDALEESAKGFRDLGADELIVYPAVDDLTEVARIADVLL